MRSMTISVSLPKGIAGFSKGVNFSETTKDGVAVSTITGTF